MSFLSPKNNLFLPFVLTFCVFIIVLLSHKVFYTLNKNFQNTYYQIKEVIFEKKANPNIVLIEIDEKTLQTLGSFPFKRDTYIPLIKNLSDAQVGVIGFDIIFSDKQDPQTDQLFAKSIEEAGNIVLGQAISSDGTLLPLLPLFSSGILAQGYFPPLVDMATDTVYSLTPRRFENDKNVYHFSITLIKAYFSRLFNQNYFTLPSPSQKYFPITERLSLPYSPMGTNEILISYINGAKFTKFSFVDIAQKDSFTRLQKDYDFKDKIILIGTAAKGIKDIFYTPNGIEYGMYIHANMINTILQEDFIVYFDAYFEWILIFLLIFLLVFFNLSRSFFVLVLSNTLLFFVFIVVLPITIITYTNVVMNYPSEIVFAFITSFTLANLVKYLIENREKSLLNKALSEYVSKDIAQEVLSGEGKMKLEGEKKYITIFFSDIEGFTTLSEQYSPEGLMSYLREYIRSMSDIIIDKKGFISKYEGDAIVALWGIFGHQETMYGDACSTALKQLEQLQVFNQKWEKEGFPRVHIRIGIHAGDVIVGNIGSEGRKLEFTALGDAMNLGSRLEGVNKIYGTQICVSEVIYEQQKEYFEFRFLDRIRVKGKKKALAIYELLGRKGELSEQVLKNYLDFEKAIAFYREKKFSEAKGIFEVLASLGDSPSETYTQRCKNFLSNPPSSDWDGVWEMTEK